MQTTRASTIGKTALALAEILLLVWGCAGHNDNGDAPRTRAYRMVLTNLTAAQPLSPPAAILHGPGYVGWILGGPAGIGLETLAAGGDPAAWLAEAGNDTAVLATAAAEGPVAPGLPRAWTWTGARLRKCS